MKWAFTIISLCFGSMLLSCDSASEGPNSASKQAGIGTINDVLNTTPDGTTTSGGDTTQNQSGGDTSTAKPGVSNTHLLSILGVNHGDSQKPSGLPAASSQSDTQSYKYDHYWGYDFSIGVDKATNFIAIVKISREAVSRLKSVGLDDEKLELLGMAKEDALKRLGDYDDASYGSYTWSFEADSKRGILTLECDTTCDVMILQWFY